MELTFIYQDDNFSFTNSIDIKIGDTVEFCPKRFKTNMLVYYHKDHIQHYIDKGRKTHISKYGNDRIVVTEELMEDTNFINDCKQYMKVVANTDIQKVEEDKAKKAHRDNFNYWHSGGHHGATGHGDICYSDADSGL